MLISWPRLFSWAVYGFLPVVCHLPLVSMFVVSLIIGRERLVILHLSYFFFIYSLHPSFFSSFFFPLFFSTLFLVLHYEMHCCIQGYDRLLSIHYVRRGFLRFSDGTPGRESKRCWLVIDIQRLGRVVIAKDRYGRSVAVLLLIRENSRSTQPTTSFNSIISLNKIRYSQKVNHNPLQVTDQWNAYILMGILNFAAA